MIVATPQGILPKLNPRIIKDNQAQVAENCILEHGDCRPLKSPVKHQDLDAATEAVFHINNSFVQFNNKASVIPSPVEAGDNRYYYTLEAGGGKKKDDETSVMNLGVPRPTDGPTITIHGDAGENILHSSSYVYTRVTAWGEESAPSKPSGQQDIYEGQSVSFSGLSDGGDGHVTHYRIYRAVGGETSNVWLLVPYQTTAGYIKYDGNDIEFDIPKGVIDDARDGLRDESLNVQLETLNWHTPPSDLKYLTSFDNGTVGGISGREVCFSEVFIPYAFPVGYRYTLNVEGVGLGNLSGTPIAFTKQSVFLFDGTSPDSYHQRKLSETQGCEGIESIASTPTGVFFASQDGLCLATSEGVQVLTLNIWSREQWLELDPSTLAGFCFNQSYYGFFKGTSKGFILPLNEEGVTTFDLGKNIIGGYLLPSNEKLYVILQDGSSRGLYEFDKGDSMESRWKSKVFISGHRNLSAFRVGGEAGSSKVSLYADGNKVVDERVVNHNEAVRLPCGFIPNEYELEIKSEKRWRGFGLANTMRELNGI